MSLRHTELKRKADDDSTTPWGESRTKPKISQRSIGDDQRLAVSLEGHEGPDTTEVVLVERPQLCAADVFRVIKNPRIRARETECGTWPVTGGSPFLCCATVARCLMFTAAVCAVVVYSVACRMATASSTNARRAARWTAPLLPESFTPYGLFLP